MRKRIVIGSIILLLLAAVIITVLLVRRSRERKAIEEAFRNEWGKSAPTFCPINYREDINTRHFDLADFSSKDGVAVPKLLRGNAQSLCEDIDVIIEHLPPGASIVLSSAYRSPQHNSNIGGEPNSRHQCAQSADLHPKGITAAQLKAIIKTLISKGLIKNGGKGLYNTFVHYDHHTPREWFA